MQPYDDQDEMIDFIRAHPLELRVPDTWRIPQPQPRTGSSRAERYRSRRPMVYEDFEPVAGEPSHTSPTLLDVATVRNALLPYPPALRHFEKGCAYLVGARIDPENAVKEGVCALEALALAICGRGATLGDAVKHLRSATGHWPLLDVIQRLYTYANAMPGVRHGKPELSTLTVDESRSLFTACAVALLGLTGTVSTPGG
jgi:hypothetical protein